MARRLLTVHISFWVSMTLFLLVSPAVAGERFSDNGDGTVTDHAQQLMWGSADNQGDIDWKQAERWIRFTFPDTIQARYDGWRMPTLAELQTLYVSDPGYDGYETDCGQDVRIAPLIRLSCGWVWASDTQAITAAVFNFNRGIHYMDRMAHHRGHRALAVRSLP